MAIPHDIKELLASLEATKNFILEDGMASISSYYKAKAAIPLVEQLCTAGLLAGQENLWLPIIQRVLEFAPYMFDRSSLLSLEPFLAKIQDFFKLKRRKMNFEIGSVDAAMKELNLLRDIYTLIPRLGEPIVQSRFIKENKDKFPLHELSQILYVWDKAGLIRREKSGRSYKVTRLR